MIWFFFQAKDGIRVLVRSLGLGDVYKRQVSASTPSILSHTLPMIGISSAVTTIPAAGITMLASKQSISPFATTHLLPQRLHVDLSLIHI